MKITFVILGGMYAALLVYGYSQRSELYRLNYLMLQFGYTKGFEPSLKNARHIWNDMLAKHEIDKEFVAIINNEWGNK